MARNSGWNIALTILGGAGFVYGINLAGGEFGHVEELRNRNPHSAQAFPHFVGDQKYILKDRLWDHERDEVPAAISEGLLATEATVVLAGVSFVLAAGNAVAIRH